MLSSFPRVEVCPEDGGSMFLWKFINDKPYYTASIPKDSNLHNYHHKNFELKYSLLSNAVPFSFVVTEEDQKNLMNVICKWLDVTAITLKSTKNNIKLDL
jgi:hypothetical protein